MENKFLEMNLDEFISTVSSNISTDENLVWINGEKPVQINKVIKDNRKFTLLLILRRNSKNTIIHMPSAQPKKEGARNPNFNRWSWPHTETVIAVSDPALYERPLHGGWYISTSPEIDYIDEIAKIIKSVMQSLHCHDGKTLIYGSSMGGFGALMLASKIHGSFAIAEVPQLNLLCYPHKGDMAKLEKGLKNGISLKNLYLETPHILSVIDRFVREKKIPSFRIISNIHDEEYENHLAFIGELASLKGLVDFVGNYDIVTTPYVVGHVPLKKQFGIYEINRYFNQQQPSSLIDYFQLSEVKCQFDEIIVNEIRLRIPPFDVKFDYRRKNYLADGEFCHVYQYSINGADPDSINPVTCVNGGLKYWSLWHRSNRLELSHLEIARKVGLKLISLMDENGCIPCNEYKSTYFSYVDGWISGIQLKNVALWARLWSVEISEEGRELYKSSIYKMLKTYLKPIHENGILGNLGDISKHLESFWIPEEYPLKSSDKQRHVLNGAQFAVISLYDAARILADSNLERKADEFNSSLMLVAELASLNSSPNGATSYGVEYYTKLDSKPNLHKATYHLTHCVLAGILYNITKHVKWLELANRWIDCCESKTSAKPPEISEEKFNDINFSILISHNEESICTSISFDEEIPAGNIEFAFYLNKNSTRIDQRWYSSSPSANFTISQLHQIEVVGFIKHTISGLIRFKKVFF